MLKIKHQLKEFLCMNIIWICILSLLVQTSMIYALDHLDNQNEIIDEDSDEKTHSTQNMSDLYENHMIKIYNFKQLQAIGTNAIVTLGDKDEKTFGTGVQVSQENNYITYSLHNHYQLMNDIPLNTPYWNLPENFTGTFQSLSPLEQDPLYDQNEDRIYIYNNYQLKTLTSKDHEEEPVMSKDMLPEYFGVGQLIYPTGSNDYLTYSSTHHYVLSKKFTEKMPNTVVNQVSLFGKDNREEASYVEKTGSEGRDFKGQVVKTIADKTYILIGNEQQLRKIGSNDPVQGAIYQAYYDAIEVKRKLDVDDNGNPILLYPGDADLLPDQTMGKVTDESKDLSQNKNGTVIRHKCIVDQETGAIDPKTDSYKSDLKYTSNANYIIFRDIDLSSSPWIPLMFQGTMTGAKKSETSSLWKDDMIQGDKPIISHVTIEQATKLDVGKQMGVGFFSTISSEVSENDIGLSKGLVKVSHIQFDQLSVKTTTSETYYPDTLVNSLLKGLGQVLGIVADGLVYLLTIGNVKLDLNETLSNLLNARKNDPTALSSGTFAGRVVGEVEISDIDMNEAQISNVNHYTGGFIGYSQGATQYDGLSNALGGLVKALSAILNVIPGIGLGDLITILLGNAIPLEKLIPTGYKNVVIKDCTMNGLSGTLGSEDKDYAGGFIGEQRGTLIQECSILNSHYQVKAKQFGGGFSGLARDDVIEGTLSGALDINGDLSKFNKINPESMCVNCKIEGTTLDVSGDDYQGGFVGTLANSAAINCIVNMSQSMDVSGQNHVGGFTGLADLGWAVDLGKSGKTNNLLGKVVDIVVQLLNSNPEAGTALLSIGGINPSYVLGCQITAPLTVSGQTYVGGLIGKGIGVQVTTSTNTDDLNKINFIKNNIYTGTITGQNSALTHIKSVKGNQYVGGLVGSLGTASVGGLLNDTTGLAKYLGFKVSDVDLIGHSTKIEATHNVVGGGFGEAIGGLIKNIRIINLKEAKGNNYVGGFVGIGSPGDLVGTNGGLTVNLLGLNYIIELSHLLSLGQAIEVQIKDCQVQGTSDGLEVEATGTRENGSLTDYVAGGFIARSGSTKISDARVIDLKSVKASDNGGYAGGFVGLSKTGGLAEVSEETDIKKLINAHGLVNAVAYLIPKYTMCVVSFIDNSSIDTFVRGDLAGGFVADFQSGTIDNSLGGKNKNYAVYNLNQVDGHTYAGGFGAKVYAGALADSTKGISILGGITGLTIQLNDLLNLINVYVPVIKDAGVKSDQGLVVTTSSFSETDATSGSAGGYIGYASAVQVSNSDVSNLKHTTVKPPEGDLNNFEDSSYYNDESHYAVSAPQYAGGYIGKLDIGNTASLGKGLQALGTTIELNNLLSALDVVASKIEKSDVTGNVGGFSVKAEGNNKELGKAGGFVGENSGSQLQNCNAYNFNYIIGEVSAGGYVGTMKPGDVASVLGDISLLDGLLKVNGGLASILQSFIPMVYNSKTTCIPCGGVVRADAFSKDGIQKGCAGGYVGYNLGGRIEGNSKREWNQVIPSFQQACSIERLRAVYGYEFAGGFSGKSECANVVDTGGISVLYGLIKLDNTLSALQAVYPTETSTEVYGPLRNLAMETWNSWVKHVGINGAYGKQLQALGEVESQEELNTIINQYAYGYDVKAGRQQAGTYSIEGGVAGGYVGQMDGGVVTQAKAQDLKSVTSLRSSGGFAGEMLSAGVADVGKISLAGLTLNGDLPILQSFIPVVNKSKTIGYQSGAMIKTTGVDALNFQGNSGGFVGKILGGKIEGTEEQSCSITNLRSVVGSQNVGGYVGISVPGSAVNVNTSSQSGLLSQLLGILIKTPGDLAKVLNATLCKIDYACVESWNDYGITINGSYSQNNNPNTQYAPCVGGFIGNASGTIIGSINATKITVQAKGIRQVIGGKHVGGFFGLADVSAIAQVSDNVKDNDTTLLGLIKLGNIDVLDSFRTYIYYAHVVGSNDNGLSVEANDQDETGTLNSKIQMGNAGGFGGSLLDGSVKNSTCENLNHVNAKNYAGGFIGHMGKSGVVDLDKAQVLDQLLNATAGVLDVFGSHSENCQVHGYHNGFTVTSEKGKEPIAGGFIGFGDLARVSNCHVTNLKKVTSNQIAGGFVGKTSYEYLGNIDAGSTYLLDPILSIVNKLLDILYIGNLENLGVIDINLGSLLQLQVLSKGNALSVTLLGLTISVALDKDRGNGVSDLAKITIGDTYIEIPCSNSQDHIAESEKENIRIGLIKANRTKVEKSSVSGIKAGYDIFGGNANDDKDGTSENGKTGGFIGYNNEGLIENNEMYYADTIRGTANLIGPFTGQTQLQSSYKFNTTKNIEGNNNNYRIYRTKSDSLLEIIKDKLDIQKDSVDDNWNVFKVKHYQNVESYDELQDAKLSNQDRSEQVDLDAYVSNAKAVLMDDTKVYDNQDSKTPNPSNIQDPCDEYLDITINKVWKDLNNLGNNRPESISINIQRSYQKGSDTITEDVKTINLSSDNATNKNVWQIVVPHLAVYTTLDDGTKAYYTYSLTESKEEGYITSLDVSNDGYTFTITNSSMPLLPDLGGKGTRTFVLAGMIGLLTILLSYKKSEKPTKGE